MSTLPEVAPFQVRSTICCPRTLEPSAVSIIWPGVGVGVAVGVTVAVAVAVGVAVAVAVAVGVGLGGTVAVAVAEAVAVAVGVAVAVAVAVGVDVGVSVGDAAPPDCLSWKASCWELPLMLTRPSTHACRCWLVEEVA